MKVIDFSPRFDTRYTFWSGMTGGLFVALAYFGTDQSQVQRYLARRAAHARARLGLHVQRPREAADAVPASSSVGVLLVRVLPIPSSAALLQRSPSVRAPRRARAARRCASVERAWDTAWTTRAATTTAFVDARKSGDATRTAAAEAALRAEASRTDDAARRRRSRSSARDRARSRDQGSGLHLHRASCVAEFPSGLVGLLLAVILCAAMSATASALNSLGTTSVVDFYKRSVRPQADDAHYLRAAKIFTVGWGAVAVGFAIGASHSTT